MFSNCYRILAAAMLLTASLFAHSLVPKQLAGAPDSFRNKQPEQATLGERSFSAILPVELTEHVLNGKRAFSWHGQLPIDSHQNLKVLVLNQGNPWQIKAWQPGQKRPMLLEDVSETMETGDVEVLNNGIPGAFYQVPEAPAGDWFFSIEADSAMEKAPSDPHGYLLVTTDNNFGIHTFWNNRNFLVGETLELNVRSILRDQEVALSAKPAGSLSAIQAEIVSPSGEKVVLDMTHQDAGAVIGAWQPVEPGKHRVTIIARGLNHFGQPFIRTSLSGIEVLNPSLDWRPEAVQLTNNHGTRLSVWLPAQDYSGENRHFRAYAEVWGTGKDGELKPVNWIGGMVAIQDGMIELGMDSRWLARAGVVSPLVLKNIRLEDPSTYVTLLEQDQVNVVENDIEFPEAARFKGIDRDMLMGPKPASLNENSNKAGGLFLVHGFCGSNSWPGSDFTNFQRFNDPKQNRSHDAFARLIASQGSGMSSYGIVAHSQGGAAALHLYTYYWSGLDNATGNRLIQSVGTPYQGTSLAGLIAAIGDIFGISCGTNQDLTYDGARAWLSGIPSWARQKVTYFTTSETDKWWRWDYCHIAAEFVLDDPEDGTTERWAGQLSGANNGGHKEGWCHTSGMRDGAQVNDSSRNRGMNSNAAR
ncbi:hypothetical protein [Acanthopleuribacter pedis]|uniref:Conditioned medium factor n=1 Tax=Acanthopleuribacter pedis TaxID=442870 RepID=A0A8J7QGF6_9BACT|nr:hypothetical protein [Acanthopleuribacter pedis]MBO1321810.1 hypothetical protein [Acanthopleuribacter pedis]